MENLEKNEVLSRAVRAGKRTYFFDVKDIKELIKLYFEVTNIKIKELKKLQKANIKFTLKHIDTLPYFSSNVFCAIADELAFYISRYVD